MSIEFDTFSTGFTVGVWWVLIITLIAKTWPTKAQRQRKKALRTALRTRDFKTIAKMNSPWLYEGHLGESPHMDDNRYQAEVKAWEQIMHYWTRPIRKIMNRRKTKTATVLQMPVQNTTHTKVA